MFVKRSQRYANDGCQKHRLAWYTSRLDKGEVDAKTARLDAKALGPSLNCLGKTAGCRGKSAFNIERKTLRWRMRSITPRYPRGCMAVGDRRSCPQRNLGLGCLRFDAPDGAYEVVHVEPRFLYQGEEVFLDTMAAGHRTYTIVELRGDATSVDVELNGRIENQPMARGSRRPWCRFARFMSDVVPLRPSVCWLQDPPGLTHLVIQSVISLVLRPFWACEVSTAPQHHLRPLPYCRGKPLLISIVSPGWSRLAL